MNFLEAIQEMKKGKKVKRDSYNEDVFIHYKGDNNTICFNGQPTYLNAYDVEAIDWKIYKEEDYWNLNDNVSMDDYDELILYKTQAYFLLKKIIEDENKIYDEFFMRVGLNNENCNDIKLEPKDIYEIRGKIKYSINQRFGF